MRRAPDDIERAEGLFRVCKGCGTEHRLSDYPTRRYGNPERYCGACRRKLADSRVGEAIIDWMRARGMTGNKVLIVKAPK